MDHLAIGQNDFQSFDVIPGGPVFDRPDPAGIAGDHAANGAGRSAARVRGEKMGRFKPSIQGVADNPRFNNDITVVLIDFL